MERIYKLCDELREVYFNKKDKSTLSKKEKDLVDEIFFGIGVDSYNRFSTFWKIRKELSRACYWYALGIAYTSSDDLYDYRKEVRKAFIYYSSGNEYLMTTSEKRALDKLPDEVTIYRAMTKKEASGKTFGVSWTLSKKVAEFFRDKYDRNHSTNNLERVIKEKVVNKSDIIALLKGRNEEEIIYVGVINK